MCEPFIMASSLGQRPDDIMVILPYLELHTTTKLSAPSQLFELLLHCDA